MGIAAALAGAASWALASALLASQSRNADTLSASALRALSALSFFTILLFALGAHHDVARMSATDILQLLGTGLLTLLTGESLFAASVAMIGMTRAFTAVIGSYNLSAFLLAAALLGETITWQTALGAVLVIAGVYLVALYGRARAATAGGPPANVTAPSTRHTALRRLSTAVRFRQFPSRRLGKLRPGQPQPAAGAGTPGPARSGQLDVRLPLLGPVRPSLVLGVLLALVTGLTWGAGAVWLRSAADGFDAAAAGTIRFPLATALLLLAAFSQPHSSFRRRPLTRRTLGVLALSGILTQGLAGLLFIVALGDIGAGKTVVLFSTAPLLALPLGAIFLKERITIWVAIGTVIVVGGVVLMA